MDPNATLQEIIELARQWHSTIDADLLDEINDRVDALRGWLERGGFCPTVDSDQLQELLRLIHE